jgi:O-ureido-D-serine cyclo-ligase
MLKPAVSADSFATVRAERHAPGTGQQHLDAHLAGRDMLVQRYLPMVAEPGERCLIFIDGRYSHAVRKRSLFLGGRHAGPEGRVVEAAEDERATARNVLKHSGFDPLYARVDLLRDESGEPRLMELELVEPSLFFDEGPGSADRFAEALLTRVRRR